MQIRHILIEEDHILIFSSETAEPNYQNLAWVIFM